MSFKLLLLLICGFFWLISYIEIVRVGFKYKVCLMPFVALSLNISWEIYNTIQGYFYAGFHITTLINFAWILLDVAILYIYFKYSHLNSKLRKDLFYALSIAFIVFSFIFQHIIGIQMGLVFGALFSAFGSNLLMSILFVHMFYKTTDLKGQTPLMAWSKCIGTFSATTLVGIIGINGLGGKINSIMYIGVITLLFDLWYIFLIHKKSLKSYILEKK